MPCNAIATASTELAGLTTDQFAEVCRQLKCDVWTQTNTQVRAYLGDVYIEYRNGELSCSGLNAVSVTAVKDKLVAATAQQRAILVLMALNQIGKVTQSQRAQTGWVLNVEV